MVGGVDVKPFAGLAYVHVDTDGFAEAGGPARLTSQGVSTDTLFTTLGVRASTEIALAERRVELRGMVGWRNASGDTTPSVTNAFATGQPFTVSGAPLSKDSFAVEAGFATELAPNVSFTADYVGAFGANSADNGFRIGLSARF